MRTYEQLYEAAQTQYQEAIDEGRDPKGDQFLVSEQERLLILDQPPFNRYELSAARHTMFGMLITVIY